MHDICTPKALAKQVALHRVLHIDDPLCRPEMSEMEGKDVLTIIALMLGPVIVAVFTLWCALYGWAA